MAASRTMRTACSFWKSIAIAGRVINRTARLNGAVVAIPQQIQLIGDRSSCVLSGVIAILLLFFRLISIVVVFRLLVGILNVLPRAVITDAGMAYVALPVWRQHFQEPRSDANCVDCEPAAPCRRRSPGSFSFASLPPMHGTSGGISTSAVQEEVITSPFCCCSQHNSGVLWNSLCSFNSSADVFCFWTNPNAMISSFQCNKRRKALLSCASFQPHWRKHGVTGCSPLVALEG